MRLLLYYNGQDSFSYTVDDGNGGSASATVNITVNPVNDAPEAQDDSYTISYGDVLSDNLLFNDTDVDGDNLRVTTNTVTTANGHIVNIADSGEFAYKAPVDFMGSDSFSYSIDDGNGGTAVAMVNIDVVAPTGADIGTDDRDLCLAVGALMIFKSGLRVMIGYLGFLAMMLFMAAVVRIRYLAVVAMTLFMAKMVKTIFLAIMAVTI